MNVKPSELRPPRTPPTLSPTTTTAPEFPDGSSERHPTAARTTTTGSIKWPPGGTNPLVVKPAVLLDMTNDRTAYAVSAETAVDSAQHMVLRVNLPCHLPPGAAQQQF
ncbi:hypothetical protein [Streptomyces decoyicus]|uniref:hypothetical protein n=1 Tax=Streptomyces decoyicus TaxID=249567 RepID=UPI003806601C